MQEEGLANEGRHHLLLLHKQVHDKRATAGSLHVYLNRARLNACEVGIFLREFWCLCHSDPVYITCFLQSDVVMVS